MATKKATAAKAQPTTEAAPAKPKRKRREPRGWYMDKYVGKIPLEEYFKDEPEFTGPGRMELLRKKCPDLFELEILDMRAVLK
jgi:hypothetical protein